MYYFNYYLYKYILVKKIYIKKKPEVVRDEKQEQFYTLH